MVNKKHFFKTIAIYSSVKSKKVQQIAAHIEEVIQNLDLKILIPESSSTSEFSSGKAYSDQFIVKNADLIVAIGGDGTLLSSARKYGSRNVPVVGVNLGNVGFLTDIAPEELTSILKEVLKGKFASEERIFLQASLNNSAKTDLALNEIVVHSRQVAQLIEYELYINDSFVFRQRADGIIVSTPTGSTAYSLSGNGPLIHPEVGAISLLPMFAHSLNTRPLILKEDSKITIKICKKGASSVSFDSHKIFRLKTGDIVDISISKAKLTLIHPLNHDFYSACRTKLGWSLGIQRNLDRNKSTKI